MMDTITIPPLSCYLDIYNYCTWAILVNACSLRPNRTLSFVVRVLLQRSRRWGAKSMLLLPYTTIYILVVSLCDGLGGNGRWRLHRGVVEDRWKYYSLETWRPFSTMKGRNNSVRPQLYGIQYYFTVSHELHAYLLYSVLCGQTYRSSTVEKWASGFLGLIKVSLKMPWSIGCPIVG